MSTAPDSEQYIKTALDFAKKAGERGIISVLRLWNLTSGTIKNANKHTNDGKNAQSSPKIDKNEALSTELTSALSDISEENRKILAMAREVFTDEWKSGRRGLTIGKRVYLEWGERFDWPDISLDEIASSGENNAKISTNGEHSGGKSPQNSINCATSGGDHLKSCADLGTSGENSTQNTAKSTPCGEHNAQNGANCATSGGDRLESHADLAASGENSAQNTAKSAPCGECNIQNGANLGSSGANLVKPDTCHGFCYGMLDHVGVLADGTVVPCCLDADGEITLGNIFESDLSEILASPRARAIADGFKHHQKVEPLCRRCGYSKRFD